VPHEVDDMTIHNGCLRVVRGPWTSLNSPATIAPDLNGNPDAGGRAGAIPVDAADALHFDDLCCAGGTIVAFGDYVPHRSSANASHFPRRAVFLTYNLQNEGDFHDRYYERMAQLRSEWKGKLFGSSQLKSVDDQNDIDALATIPGN
jgi:Phytanoyl-CoA dioxygenase (PhyH)